MSELKSFIVLYDANFVRAYEKSEADKVIAELQSKITLASLADDRSSLRHKRCNYCSELQRQKYKRCVELADSCAFRAIVAKMENKRFPTPKNSWRMILYPKWHKRWLAIAEKFKETK